MLRLIILRILESYFRHRWLYLVPMVLMMAAAFVFFIKAKPKYIANGVLFVQRESLLARLTSVKDPNVSWQTPASVTVGELNELLETDAFIRAVISQTDLEAEMDQGPATVDETIDQVREAVWVNSIGNNQVRVSAVDENPQLASQFANATIASFILWKINADRTESQAAHSFFTDIISTYKAELDLARQNLNDYLIERPEPLKGDRPVIEQLEISRLQSEVDLAESRYSSALDKDEDARLASSQAESDVRQSYVLIDAPRIPEKPDVSLKQTAIMLLVFMAIGVFLSIAGIVGGALLDRSFRFPVDVWYGVNLTVLAMVPDISPTAREKRRMRSKARKELKSVAKETTLAENGECITGLASTNDQGSEYQNLPEPAEEINPEAIEIFEAAIKEPDHIEADTQP
jgi:uncharacterized protein involved in exopolysaccharide biosynthesis